MIRSVRLYGDTKLRERCGSCEHFYEYYQQMAQDMLDTMLSHDGVGLSSNQIGLNLRLFVFENGREYVAVRNPIIEFSGPLDYDDEGCLSLPGLSIPVARYKFASLRGTTPGGEPIPEMFLRDYPARVVQHELDHLNGLTILEATGPVERNVQRKRWLKRYPRLRKWWDSEYLERIDKANEELLRERAAEVPRIILPGSEADVRDTTRPRVGNRGPHTPSGTRQRVDPRISSAARRRPLPTSPDGGYT